MITFLLLRKFKFYSSTTSEYLHNSLLLNLLHIKPLEFTHFITEHYFGIIIEYKYFIKI